MKVLTETSHYRSFFIKSLSPSVGVVIRTKNHNLLIKKSPKKFELPWIFCLASLADRVIAPHLMRWFTFNILFVIMDKDLLSLSILEIEICSVNAQNTYRFYQHFPFCLKNLNFSFLGELRTLEPSSL